MILKDEVNKKEVIVKKTNIKTIDLHYEARIVKNIAYAVTLYVDTNVDAKVDEKRVNSTESLGNPENTSEVEVDQKGLEKADNNLETGA